MQLTAKSCLIATAYLTLTANALPHPIPYSVVNVDGGAQSSALPTTVYQTVVESGNSGTTVSVTIVATPTTTAVMTDYTTSWSHGETTETALVPEVSLSLSSTAIETHSVPIPDVTSRPAVEDSTVTIVSVETAAPTTTTSYYDNGMWHTSYAIKGAYSVHPGQWHPSSSPAGYAASSTGAQLAGRALPTGYYSAVSWNSTRHW